MAPKVGAGSRARCPWDITTRPKLQHSDIIRNVDQQNPPIKQHGPLLLSQSTVNRIPEDSGLRGHTVQNGDRCINRPPGQDNSKKNGDERVLETWRRPFPSQDFPPIASCHGRPKSQAAVTMPLSLRRSLYQSTWLGLAFSEHREMPGR